MSTNNQLADLMNQQMRLQAQAAPNHMRNALGFSPTLNQVRIERTKLLDVLRDNLEKHQAAFKEAVSEYQEALEKYLNYRLELMKAGKRNDLPEPILPESHEKAYLKVIRQLELSADDMLILDDHQFQTYVMDDWDWKYNFVNNTQMLAGYKSLGR